MRRGCLFLMAVLILSGRMTSQAAERETTGMIGYYVKAMIPENQTDNALTYFDLMMKPGQTRQLIVEVTNETNESMIIDMETISASTNRNGIIDYRTPGIKDRTLTYPFAEIASAKNSSLTIGGGQTKAAYIVVKMPEASYDGVILGGIVFTRRMEESPGRDPGTSIRNRYNYVIGTVLRETEDLVEPDFELENVIGETVNYYPAMVHNIRNKEAAIAKNIEINVQVTDSSGNTVAKVNQVGVDMAPNSVMPMAVTPFVTEQGALQLKSGEYNSEVELRYNGRRWFFAESFVVSGAEAEHINSQTPEAEYRKDSDVRVEMFLRLNIVVLIFVIFLLFRRRRKEREG